MANNGEPIQDIAHLGHVVGETGHEIADPELGEEVRPLGGDHKGFAVNRRLFLVRLSQWFFKDVQSHGRKSILQVLVQGAAQSDVQFLVSAAHREQRHPPVQGGADQRQPRRSHDPHHR